MATQRKTPPKRPARPSRPRSTGGGKASFGIHLSLFNGWFSGGSLVRTGGGGRGRGKGGLFKRLTGLARRAAKELQGKPSGGKAPAGGRPHGGDSEGFDRFKASRPDLFDNGDQGDQVGEVDQDDEDQEQRERTGGAR